jgi:hypothetical protein
MWPCIVTNFLIIKPTRCTEFSNLFLEMKLYMFQKVPLSIIRSYSLYTQQWHMSYGFVVDSLRAGSVWNILILLLESCLQTCMTYTVAECTVNNSWWWTEELSETCRVSFLKINLRNSASSWFYYKKRHMLMFCLLLCSLVLRSVTQMSQNIKVNMVQFRTIVALRGDRDVTVVKVLHCKS